jgi:hypothetical protein
MIAHVWSATFVGVESRSCGIDAPQTVNVLVYSP